jgi:hypothetical protein
LEPAGYRDFSGLAALMTATLVAALSRQGNFTGAATLESESPAAELWRLANLGGTAALESYLPDADLSLLDAAYFSGGDNLRSGRPVPTGKHADAFRYFGVKQVDS